MAGGSETPNEGFKIMRTIQIHNVEINSECLTNAVAIMNCGDSKVISLSPVQAREVAAEIIKQANEVESKNIKSHAQALSDGDYGDCPVR